MFLITSAIALMILSCKSCKLAGRGGAKMLSLLNPHKKKVIRCWWPPWSWFKVRQLLLEGAWPIQCCERFSYGRHRCWCQCGRAVSCWKMKLLLSSCSYGNNHSVSLFRKEDPITMFSWKRNIHILSLDTVQKCSLLGNPSYAPLMISDFRPPSY